MVNSQVDADSVFYNYEHSKSIPRERSQLVYNRVQAEELNEIRKVYTRKNQLHDDPICYLCGKQYRLPPALANLTLQRYSHRILLLIHPDSMLIEMLYFDQNYQYSLNYCLMV